MLISLQPSKHFDTHYFISVFQQRYEERPELPFCLKDKERNLGKLGNWYKVHCWKGGEQRPEPTCPDSMSK